MQLIISTDIYDHVHKQIIYLKAFTHVYVQIRGNHKQAKKRAALRVQKHCAWLSRVGIEPTIVSLEDAKRNGLDDLHESVRLDVMDLPGEKNLTYLNVSHQIIWGGGAGYELFTNLIYPNLKTNNILRF